MLVSNEFLMQSWCCSFACTGLLSGRSSSHPTKEVNLCHRNLLGGLSRAAGETVRELMVDAPGEDGLVTGMVVVECATSTGSLSG